MAKTGLAHDRIQPYRHDQIVVALPHAAEVLHELTELGAQPAQKDTDDLLDLALVELRASDRAVARLEAEMPTLRRRVEQERDAPAAPLDLLLAGLRERFASRHGGWTPTMGKNRVAWRVAGEYVIGGGGENLPRPPQNEPHELPPRTVDPEAAAEPGPRARVGVLDTSLAPHHWYAGSYVALPDAIRDPSGQGAPPSWPEGHATFLAGLIVRQEPTAQLDVRCGLGGEDATADTWDVAKALVRLARSGADVLNLSFGCVTEDDQAPLVLARAIDRLGPELVVVAAAGNHGAADGTGGIGPLTPVWPAALDDVVAVGAADGDGLAWFSPDAPWVDLVAPGVDVLSTYLAGTVLAGPHDPATESRAPVQFSGWARWSGTSFATAVVSGKIASRTRPGRVSARQALLHLQQEWKPLPQGGKPFVPMEA